MPSTAHYLGMVDGALEMAAVVVNDLRVSERRIGWLFDSTRTFADRGIATTSEAEIAIDWLRATARGAPLRSDVSRGGSAAATMRR